MGDCRVRMDEGEECRIEVEVEGAIKRENKR
jgi:hypothetical protein